MKKDQLFLMYFDSLGFECIENLSNWDKKMMWATLSEKPMMHKFPVGALIMRAKANPQRFPEIYTVWSSMSEKELRAIAESSPQALADSVREKGVPVFVTSKQKEVIK